MLPSMDRYDFDEQITLEEFIEVCNKAGFETPNSLKETDLRDFILLYLTTPFDAPIIVVDTENDLGEVHILLLDTSRNKLGYLAYYTDKDLEIDTFHKSKSWRDMLTWRNVLYEGISWFSNVDELSEDLNKRGTFVNTKAFQQFIEHCIALFASYHMRGLQGQPVKDIRTVLDLHGMSTMMDFLRSGGLLNWLDGYWMNFLDNVNLQFGYREEIFDKVEFTPENFAVALFRIQQHKKESLTKSE